MNIGARIGGQNLSIVSNCDDVFLISPNRVHLIKLLKCCESYANKW